MKWLDGFVPWRHIRQRAPTSCSLWCSSLDLNRRLPQCSLHLCRLQVENVYIMPEGNPFATLALGTRYAGLAFILYVRCVDPIFVRRAD